MFKLLLIAGIVLLASAVSVCSEAPQSNLPFIDRDGDGFDDNAADYNNDGIPDAYRTGGAEAADAVASTEAYNFAGRLTPSPEALAGAQDQKKSRYFNSLKMRARGLCSNRCGYDSGFGPGNGIGVGAVKGGGGCEGGVCPIQF